MIITDETAKKLYNRFERLRHGGNYASTKQKAEHFCPNRVRELFAAQNPYTQTDWLRQVGSKNSAVNTKNK